MVVGDVAQELAAAVGQTLPAEYIAFLDGLPARREVHPSSYLEFSGRAWDPHDRQRLAEPVRYNRDEAHPSAHETLCIVAELQTMDVITDGEPSEPMVEAVGEGGFTVDRLAHGFCIGYDDNGEPLFVDLDTGAVFAYYRDGVYLERWAVSLVEIITDSRDQVFEDEA